MYIHIDIIDIMGPFDRRAILSRLVSGVRFCFFAFWALLYYHYKPKQVTQQPVETRPKGPCMPGTRLPPKIVILQGPLIVQLPLVWSHIPDIAIVPSVPQIHLNKIFVSYLQIAYDGKGIQVLVDGVHAARQMQHTFHVRVEQGEQQLEKCGCTFAGFCGDFTQDCHDYRGTTDMTRYSVSSKAEMMFAELWASQSKGSHASIQQHLSRIFNRGTWIPKEVQEVLEGGITSDVLAEGSGPTYEERRGMSKESCILAVPEGP